MRKANDAYEESCCEEAEVKKEYDALEAEYQATSSIRRAEWIREIEQLIEKMEPAEKHRISKLSPKKISDMALDDMVVTIYENMSATTVSDFLEHGINGYPASEFKVIYAAMPLEPALLTPESLIKEIYYLNPALAGRYTHSNKELLEALSKLIRAVGMDIPVCDYPVPVEVDVKNLTEYIEMKINENNEK